MLIFRVVAIFNLLFLYSQNSHKIHRDMNYNGSSVLTESKSKRPPCSSYIIFVRILFVAECKHLQLSAGICELHGIFLPNTLATFARKILLQALTEPTYNHLDIGVS